MIIIFIGPPFSGKGTQAELLGKHLNLPVFSIGALIRKAYWEKEPKAVKGFEKYSMKGLHVPIDLKFPLLEKEMSLSKVGFILDNFPATSEDLRAFIDYLSKNSLTVDKVFYIFISQEEMLKRMRQRTGRPDDTLEIVVKRRDIQDKDRISVIEYFKQKGVLEEINGEKSINALSEEIRRKARIE